MVDLNEQNSWDVNYPSIGLQLKCLLNTEEDKVRENIAHALTLGLPEIWPCENKRYENGERIENETQILICAGGPTLLEHIEEIRDRQNAGAKVVALANVAHLLLAHDIRPNAHVLLDAKPRNAEFVTNCNTTLFISSQCDPKVFENALKTDNDVFLYHAVNNDEEFEVIRDHYSDKDGIEGAWVPVQGGSTITTRTIRLFTLLGYKNFHTFGFDSCMKGEQHHAYEQPDADKQKVFKFDFEGTMYRMTPWMMGQFMEFQTFVKMFGMSINLEVHGDGLIADFIHKAYGQHQIKIEED